MSIINIVHLIPGIRLGGGAESVVYDLCRYSDPMRFRLTVLYWNDRDEYASPMREAGSQVIKLPLIKVVSLRSVIVIASALREYKADLLHTHFFDGDLLGFMASRLARVRMVSHIHSYPFLSEPRHAWRYRLMSKGVSRFICVSEFVKQHCVSYAKIPESRINVVHNGIDCSRFEDRLSRTAKDDLKRSLGVLPDDIVVGNVSRVLAEKGHDVFLKAAQLVLARKPGIRFLVVGDGGALDSVKALAERLGISQSVIFTGMRRDIPELLSCMDIFVFPAINEAFGLCLTEAMAAGRPIVAANSAALPEIVRDGLEGLLFLPDDEQALACSLLRLLDDPSLAKQLATNALQRSRCFTSAAMTQDMEKVYTEVLGE